MPPSPRPGRLESRRMGLQSRNDPPPPRTPPPHLHQPETPRGQVSHALASGNSHPVPDRVRGDPHRHHHHGRCRDHSRGRRTGPARPVLGLRHRHHPLRHHQRHGQLRPAEVGESALPVAAQPRSGRPRPDQDPLRDRSEQVPGAVAAAGRDRDGRNPPWPQQHHQLGRGAGADAVHARYVRRVRGRRQRRRAPRHPL